MLDSVLSFAEGKLSTADATSDATASGAVVWIFVTIADILEVVAHQGDFFHHARLVFEFERVNGRTIGKESKL